MAVPTAPTATSICTEALKRASVTFPTTTQLTRAAGWLEEIKRDISRNKRYLKSLFSTTYGIATIGKSKYGLPTSYAGNLSITLLDGVNIGTAQAGASNTVTLASGEDITDDFIIGKHILITSGTGVNSYSQCTAYNETTKVATVADTWATNPASGSGYMVVDITYPLGDPIPIGDIDNAVYATSKARPLVYAILGNSTVGDIYLYPAPDKAYGIEYRYYLNLQTLDLTGTLMGTLYQDYFDVFTQGVMAKQFQEDDDGRAKNEFAIYWKMVANMGADEFDRDNFITHSAEPAYSVDD